MSVIGHAFFKSVLVLIFCSNSQNTRPYSAEQWCSFKQQTPDMRLTKHSDITNKYHAQIIKLFDCITNYYNNFWLVDERMSIKFISLYNKK